MPFLARLVRSFGLDGEPRVLDLGCGTGRLLKPLAVLGWRVVGMDPQPENLAEARRLVTGTSGVEVVGGGFADLEAVETFDLVVAVGGPWWYLLSPGERADGLYRVARALRPGGVVVLDGANFEWILDHYRDPRRLSLTASACAESRNTTSTGFAAPGRKPTRSARRPAKS